jgi:putative hydrolase of the HAD superfamily
MIRAVIFDLDNTLTDFMKMKDESIICAVEAMIDMGLSISSEEAIKLIYEIYDREGIEYQLVFDTMLRGIYRTVPPAILAAAIINYRRARDFNLNHYPHVNVTLMELVRRGFKLAVLSDAPSLQAWQRLHHLSLQHVFDHVIAFDDTGQRKPAPAPFQRAMELLGIPAEELVMVGDWPERDMKGASALNIRTVYARYGDTHKTENPGADFEIDDIIELLDILDELNGV